MTYQRKPRARAVLRGVVTMYSTIDSSKGYDDPACWSSEPGPQIALRLYSDGTTRTMGEKVKHTARCPGRPELVVLVAIGRNALLPSYCAVSATEWHGWQRQVKAAGDPATLPALPRRKKASAE